MSERQGGRIVPFEVFDPTHPDHVHQCASKGYPSHQPSRFCLCVGCGERFDATPIPPPASDHPDEVTR